MNRMFGELHKPNTEHEKLCNHQCTNTKTSAFSLVELLIALVVFSLIIMLALPSFSTLLMNGRISSNMNALVNTLNYARSTALHQSVPVRVCPFSAANSITCGGSWNAGWIVITQPAVGAPVLLKSQELTNADTTMSASAVGVLFDTHGLATTASNFKICDTRGGTFAQSVQVLATGYVQSGQTPGVAVWDNSGLTCP